MRPTRINGLTDAQRDRRCTGKARWPDEMSARAGALFSLENYGGVDQLWVYRCALCRGWHLTKQKTGVEPVTIKAYHPEEVAA